jgi:hypothetical protein
LYCILLPVVAMADSSASGRFKLYRLVLLS